MARDLAALTQALAGRLRTNFAAGKDEEWDADRAADELATAIADTVHAYLDGARATGVTSEVRNGANAVIGTAQQTGGGEIQ